MFIVWGNQEKQRKGFRLDYVSRRSTRVMMMMSTFW